MKVAACILVIPKRQTNLRLSSGILPVVNSYCKETRFTLSATSGSPCTLKHGDKSFTSVTLLVLFVNSISNLWPRSLSHPTVSRSPPVLPKSSSNPNLKHVSTCFRIAIPGKRSSDFQLVRRVSHSRESHLQQS